MPALAASRCQKWLRKTRTSTAITTDAIATTYTAPITALVIAVSATGLAPEEPREIDVAAPSVRLRREEARVRGIPPARLQASTCRAAPVVRNAEERTGLPHAHTVEANPT